MIDERRFPGPQGRRLFAYLITEQGRPVPRDELAEALWGDQPPATWDRALSVLVSKLRVVLSECGVDGASALTGAFGCYRLELPEGSWIDVVAAAGAAQEAEDALARDDATAARTAAGVAESLLRQSFLPGDEGSWAEQKRRELGEVRARALTALADSCLRTGDANEAVRWAEQAIALEPFRESGYRRLMEAHVASGNRAEGLRVYERCRRLLADELGAYPSPETDAIYRRLLEAPSQPAEAPAPTAPATAPTAQESASTAVLPEPVFVADEPHGSPEAGSRHRGRRRWLAAGVAVAVAAGATVVAVVASSGGGTHPTVAANSIVALDASDSVAATVSVGARPVAMTSVADALWVANFDDQTVTRVDAASRQVVRTIPVGETPIGIAAAGDGGVWVADGAGGLSRIDPSYNRLTSTRVLAATEPGDPATLSARPVLAAFGSIWAVDPAGLVARLDPRTGRRIASVDVGNLPSAIASGAGSVWVTNGADGTVTRIDAATLLTTTVPVGHGPAAVAVNAAGVWVADAGDDTLVRIDPATNAIAGSTEIGDGPAAILSTPTALWVANARDGTVMRLDPQYGHVKKTIHLGGTPNALAYAAGQVWVSLAPAPPPPPATGGVAHFTLEADLPSYDPALSPSPSFFYATCANLVTYPDKPAPAGSRIVPEVAEAIPTPTDGGRTYTFTIRPGFRFSPPSNEPVTAATFKTTIERVTNPRLKSPYTGAFSGIAGYHAYVTGKSAGLAGIVARGDTLTIRLSRPDGGFLAWLAAGAACAVPSGTPPVEIEDIPSAGPYYIASYTPHQQLVLKRNPNYRGERPHRLDQIVFTIGVDPAPALTDVEAGKADYAFDGLPPDAAPKLEAEYGPGSNAAKDGHQQYFISEANVVRYLYMNTSRPLFSNVRLRRAVNYAIDRPALVAQGRRFAIANVLIAGKPTDSYLTPATIDTTDIHLYPLNGPDLRRAKRLAGHVHAAAVLYTPNASPWLQEAQIVRRDLKPLGIDVQIKTMAFGVFYRRISRPGEPFDLAISSWGSQTTDPAEVLDTFNSRALGFYADANYAHLDDAAFDRKLAAASKLSGTPRYRAYSRLAVELERDVAPVAAFTTNASRDFFSARIGCQLYQPVYGIDLAALCLRH